MWLFLQIHSEVSQFKSLSQRNRLIRFNRAIEEFLLPILISSLKIKCLQRNTERKWLHWELSILVAYVNISDFYLQVIHHSHAQSLDVALILVLVRWLSLTSFFHSLPSLWEMRLWMHSGLLLFPPEMPFVLVSNFSCFPILLIVHDLPRRM